MIFLIVFVAISLRLIALDGLSDAGHAVAQRFPGLVTLLVD